MTDFALKDGATFLGLMPLFTLFSPSWPTTECKEAKEISKRQKRLGAVISADDVERNELWLLEQKLH
jgi:hypothetical protein